MEAPAQRGRPDSVTLHPEESSSPDSSGPGGWRLGVKLWPVVSLLDSQSRISVTLSLLVLTTRYQYHFYLVDVLDRYWYQLVVYESLVVCASIDSGASTVNAFSFPFTRYQW